MSVLFAQCMRQIETFSSLSCRLWQVSLVTLLLLGMWHFYLLAITSSLNNCHFLRRLQRIGSILSLHHVTSRRSSSISSETGLLAIVPMAIDSKENRIGTSSEDNFAASAQDAHKLRLSREDASQWEKRAPLALKRQDVLQFRQKLQQRFQANASAIVNARYGQQMVLSHVVGPFLLVKGV